MELSQFLTLLLGAFFGSAGWLVVGMFLSRRAQKNAARSAARAVYFELVMNDIDVGVAGEHFVFQPLRRAAFDRLLPELSSWLSADELETIVRAYMSHAGYDQAQRDEKLPAPVRKAVLRTVADQHRTAVELLRVKAFSNREAALLTTSVAAGGSRNA